MLSFCQQNKKKKKKEQTHVKIIRPDGPKIVYLLQQGNSKGDIKQRLGVSLHDVQDVLTFSNETRQVEDRRRGSHEK